MSPPRVFSRQQPQPRSQVRPRSPAQDSHAPCLCSSWYRQAHVACGQLFMAPGSALLCGLTPVHARVSADGSCHGSPSSSSSCATDARVFAEVVVPSSSGGGASTHDCTVPDLHWACTCFPDWCASLTVDHRTVDHRTALSSTLARPPRPPDRHALVTRLSARPQPFARQVQATHGPLSTPSASQRAGPTSRSLSRASSQRSTHGRPSPPWQGDRQPSCCCAPVAMCSRAARSWYPPTTRARLRMRSRAAATRCVPLSVS